MGMSAFIVGNMKLEASSAEMAYRAVCCFFNTETPVAVIGEDGHVRKFTRKLDESGNLIEIKEER